MLMEKVQRVRVQFFFKSFRCWEEGKELRKAEEGLLREEEEEPISCCIWEAREEDPITTTQ